MMTSAPVDVAVVGRGIIGAAAARHLAESGTTVALIGPDEPADRRASSGPFSSHPDEGRITRIAGRNAFWTAVAARSVDRYADISARSGIEFHMPRGLVVGFGDAADWVDRGRQWGSDARLVDHDWVRASTGVHMPEAVPVLHEGPPAGWINPRRMVAAQTALVEAAGGVVIREAVDAAEPNGSSVRLRGRFGTIEARRVLLATGAFGSQLLDGRDLLVERRPRTILRAEMGPDDRIPSVILDSPADDRLHEIYWVPPVRYPDGRLCLKIGGNLKDHGLLDDQTIVDWFHGDGSAIEAQALENSLRALVPEVEITSLWSEPCVITGTPSGNPYIGWVDDRVAVAIGGNGSAAKSGDELGRLAASLFGSAVPDWADVAVDPGDLAPRFV